MNKDMALPLQALQLALPFLTGLLGVWIASRLSAVRSHEDKVWLRKAEAYSSILWALAGIRDFYATHLDDEYNHRESTEDQDENRLNLFTEAKQQLSSTIAREIWLLPDLVRIQTENLKTELNKRHDSWFEHLDHCEYETKKIQEEIEKIARAEMRRPGFFK